MIPKAIEYKGTVFSWHSVHLTTVILVGAVPSIGGLLFGYDIGATSYALAQLEKGASSSAAVVWADTLASSNLLKGCFGAASIAGALGSSFALFSVADTIGRLGEMFVSTILFLIGIVLIMASGMSSLSQSVGGGLGCVIAGKFIFGLASGFATHAAPTYMAEMAPARLRGYMVAGKEAMMSIGVVLGNGVGFAYRGVDLGWVVIYASALPVVCLYGLGISLLPFSARWLVLKGRISEARAALARIYYHSDDLRTTLDEIVTNERLDILGQKQQSVTQEARTSPAVLSALKAALGLIVLQQLTGQPSVLYFATTIFRKAGVTEAAPLVVAVVKLLATIYSCFLVERRGRRKLLLAGTAIMATSLFILALALATNYSAGGAYFSDDDDDSATMLNTTNSTRLLLLEDSYNSTSTFSPPWMHRKNEFGPRDTFSHTGGDKGLGAMDLVSIGSMIGSVTGYQIGFGPICWLLLSELFASHLRARVVALGIQLNFATNLLVSLAFPSLLHYAGAALTFVFFGMVCVYSYHFIVRFVPETKGLTLEEIQHVLIMMPRTEDGALPENSMDTDTDDEDDEADPEYGASAQDRRRRRGLEPPFAGVAQVISPDDSTPLMISSSASSSSSVNEQEASFLDTRTQHHQAGTLISDRRNRPEAAIIINTSDPRASGRLLHDANVVFASSSSSRESSDDGDLGSSRATTI